MLYSKANAGVHFLTRSHCRHQLIKKRQLTYVWTYVCMCGMTSMKTKAIDDGDK